jgi:hypothetical protein
MGKMPGIGGGCRACRVERRMKRESGLAGLHTGVETPVMTSLAVV